MSKYSNEFKLEVIKYYNEGHGFTSTAKYFNIPAMSTVQKWVRKYNSYQGTIGKIADNLLKRDFKVDKPNQKWATDVT